MPEIMPFGKYKGRSVEQIVLKDYKYFDYVINNMTLHSFSLNERFDHVDKVVNNFVSEVNCATCDELPAEKISIYQGFDSFRVSDLSHVYCSYDCYYEDPIISHKAVLQDLKFKNALSDTKSDTNGLVKVMTDCMGLKEGRKDKNYLESFFNKVKLRSDVECDVEVGEQIKFWE